MRQVNEVKVVKRGAQLIVTPRRVLKNSVVNLGDLVIDLDGDKVAQAALCAEFLVECGLGTKST